jgi:hypothetical protein
LELIADEVLRPRGGDGKEPRRWQQREHAVAAAGWLLCVYDALLHCPSLPGRLSGLSVLHSNSSFYGDFVLCHGRLTTFFGDFRPG